MESLCRRRASRRCGGAHCVNDQLRPIGTGATISGRSWRSQPRRRATKSPSMNPTVALRISRTTAEISPVNQRNRPRTGTEFCATSRTSIMLRPMMIPIFTRASLFFPMSLTICPNRDGPRARGVGGATAGRQCTPDLRGSLSISELRESVHPDRAVRTETHDVPAHAGPQIEVAGRDRGSGSQLFRYLRAPECFAGDRRLGGANDTR